jgi:hypothetical protein
MSNSPPTFLESLMDATNYLDAASRNDEISKEDLIKSMETKLSIIIGKMVAAPTGDMFNIFKREDEERPLSNVKK